VSDIDELARLGSATVYEAGGRGGYVDADFHQLIAGSRAAGPARIALCAQDDNLMVHAVMEKLQPGEVLVLCMPEPRPVALMGDLLLTQAIKAGAAAVLVDASVRDVEEIAQMGTPVWARWIRVKGAEKETLGELDVPVEIGATTINPGDILVLDADGIAVVQADRVAEVTEASQAREEKERIKRERLEGGALSWEIDGLKEKFSK
jgi:4-hydroxy-4-methyl-2-oxoglutarate aldolase